MRRIQLCDKGREWHSSGREAHMQKRTARKIMEYLETSNPFIINKERRRVMGYQLK